LEQLECGKAHTVIVVSDSQQSKRIYAFGHQDGLSTESSTHVPTLVTINKLGETNADLKFIHVRYNTSIAVDRLGRIFMWGENTSSLKMRKPKLFYVFPSRSIEIKQLVLGRRHGLIRTNEPFGAIYGWGDGTYGELGVTEGLPFEKPQRLPHFEAVEVVSVAAGSRHSLVLDSNGQIYAMGDNSED